MHSTSHDWLDADLLFFWGDDLVSRTIEFFTRGPSHVGILARGYAPDHERLLLFESTTLCKLPDVMAHAPIEGVQAHYPEDRIEAYPGRVARMRLADFWRLDRDEADLLRGEVHELHGLPYDLEGAVLTELRLTRHWFRPYADMGSVFCSEMCAALLMRLGRLGDDNPSRYTPAGLMRRLRKTGKYSAPEFLK